MSKMLQFPGPEIAVIHEKYFMKCQMCLPVIKMCLLPRLGMCPMSIIANHDLSKEGHTVADLMQRIIQVVILFVKFSITLI